LRALNLAEGRTLIGGLLKGNHSFFYYLTLITELGLVMASCILIGLGVGLYIDGKFNVAPLGLLVCLLLGIFAAFFNAYKLIMKKIK
jgi:uncharacterized membrane protein YczE